MATETTTTPIPYGTHTLHTEPAPGLPDYLVRVVAESDADGHPDLTSCDYAACFASCIEDIIEGTSGELRPMYYDTRHEICMCQRCVDAGRHLADG